MANEETLSEGQAEVLVENQPAAATPVQEAPKAPPVSEPALEEEFVDAHHEGDTTVFMGREYNIPIYTSVFIALGVLTVLEVSIAEIISSNAKIPVLVAMSIAKAALVVLYYMHLKTDSRIFAITLAIPLGVAILSALFLLGIPTGY